MPVLERLSNLDLNDLISCQPESTENMTDADSEKAALCSLRDKHHSTDLANWSGSLGSGGELLRRTSWFSPPSSPSPSASC